MVSFNRLLLLFGFSLSMGSVISGPPSHDERRPNMPDLSDISHHVQSSIVNCERHGK